MKSSPRLFRFLALAGSSLLSICYVHAQDGTWNSDSAGNWSDTARWTGGTVASGADFTATLGNVITADRIITLDGNYTIGNITASDTSHNYTISGANILTLDRTDATKPTISVTQSGRTLTIGSVIAGDDGLLKSGAGTLVFTSTSNNTFTGGFDISGGTVQYDSATNANAWGDAGNVITFTGSATLHNNNNAYTLARSIQVNGTNTATLSGAFGESTNITGAVTGTGNVNISGNSNNWQVTMSNTANTLSGTVWVASNSAGNTGLTVNSLADGADSTKSLKMGAGGVTADFTLTGSSTTPTVWTNRAVELAGTTGAVSIRNGSSNAARSLTISRDLLFTTTSSGNKTLTLGGANTGANTFAGIIGNNGASTTAITKADAGTWIFSNASNSYTGGTNVTGGTLLFASGALGSSGTINASGGTLLWLAGNTQDISSRLAFTAGATSTFNTNGNDVTFASAIGSSNTGNFVKTGLGTLTLQGTNTFTSGTKQLNGGGTLVLDYTTNDNRKLSTGALTLAGGTIVLKGGTTTAETASSTIFNTNNAGSFFVRDGGTAKINLNAFTLGTGSTVSFSHDSMATTDRLNTTGILGAWFTVGNRWATNAGVNGAGGSAGAGAAADGDIVGYTGGAIFTNALVTDNNTNADLTGALTLSGSKTVNTLRIVSDGDNQVLNLGANNLSTSNLTGTNTATGGGILYAGGANGNYTIQGTTGGLRIFNQNGQGQLINVYSGTLTVDATIGSGSSPLVKSGEGTLVVNKALSTGAVRAYQGVLRLTGAGTLTAGSSVQNGAAIELGNGVAITSGATLNITGTGISNGGALRNVATTSSSYAAAITIGTGGARINSDSGTLTLSGGVVTSLFNDVTFGGAGNTTVQTTAISGAGGLTKDGAGTTTLSASNSYTGATNVNEGTLQVSGAGSINTTSAINVAAGASFVYNSSVALTKAPTLNGTLGNPATFSGSGNLGTIAMTLNSLDDVISPGNSPGIQAYGASQTWSSFTYDWELNDWNNMVAGTDIDQIQVTGSLDLSAILANQYVLNILSLTDLNASGLVGAGGLNTFTESSRTWDIITTTTGITGFDASEWQIVSGGFQDAETGTWSLGLDGGGNNLVLSYTAVPEPGAALLGSLGLLMILRRRR